MGGNNSREENEPSLDNLTNNPHYQNNLQGVYSNYPGAHLNNNLGVTQDLFIYYF
jgi:hypothetical protein